jgi:hypothetical protein
VHNGATGEAFVQLRRAEVIEIEFPDGTVERLELQDVHDPQNLNVSGPAVDSLTIRVVETNGPDGQPLAISELEFFARR